MIGRWAVLFFLALSWAAHAQNISGGGASLPPVIEGGCIIGTGGVWVGGDCSGSGTPVTSVTGTAAQITASPTTGGVVVSLPAAVELTTSLKVGSPTGVTSAGDVNISGSFKVNGVAIGVPGGGGSVETVTLAPGLATTIGTQNTGSDAITVSGTIHKQLWPVNKATSYSVAAADTGNLLISTGGSVTFTLDNPAAGTKGATYQFGSDGTQGYTLTTDGGTALIYGCTGAGAASVAFAANVDVQVVDTGTAYKCSELGGAGGSGSGTVNSGTGPAMAQYPAGTGTTVGPVTISGDATIAQGGALAIGANKITSAMIRQGVARSVVGVTGNATANVADIQGTANQALVVNSAGTALAFGQVNLASSAAVTGTIMAGSFPALTGDVTTSAGSLATAIGANKVTSAMLRQGVARSVIGVAGNATANEADIQGTADQVLRVTAAGTGLGFGALNLAATAAITGYDTSLLSVNGGSFSSKEPAVLTDGATIAINLAQSHVFTITETVNNRLYLNPTGGNIGDTYLFIRTVDGTGITPVFGDAWFFQNSGALPTLSTADATDLIGCIVTAKSGSDVTGFFCNVLGLDYTITFDPLLLNSLQVLLDPSDHTTTFANGTCTSSTVSTNGASVGSIRDKSTNGSCWVATGGTITLNTDGTAWWLSNNGSSSLVSATGTGANPNTIGQDKATIATVMGVQYASNAASKLMLNIRTNGNNPRFVCGLNTAGGTSAGPSVTARQLDADTNVTLSPGTAVGYTGVPLAHECNAAYNPAGALYTWSNNGTLFFDDNAFAGGNTSNTASSPTPTALATASSSDRLYFLVVWTPATAPTGGDQAQLQTYVCHKMGITC